MEVFMLCTTTLVIAWRTQPTFAVVVVVASMVQFVQLQMSAWKVWKIDQISCITYSLIVVQMLPFSHLLCSTRDVRFQDQLDACVMLRVSRFQCQQFRIWRLG